MLKKLFYLCGMISWLASTAAFAASADIQQTENTTIQLFRHNDNEMIAKVSMKPDWHIYWKNPGEIGKPTLISADNNEAEIINQSVPQIHTVYELMQEYIYENTAYFALHTDNPNPILTFDFVECNDVCQPDSLTFNTADISPVTEHEWQKIKTEAEATFPQKITLTSPLHHNEISFPYTEDADIAFVPAEHDVVEPETVTFEKKDDIIHVKWLNTDEAKLQQALIITPQQAYLADITYQNEQLGEIVYILLLAFFGGIILNAMPCVFPILSLKIFTLIKQRRRRKPWKEALQYTCGVVFSFWLLTACIVYLKNQGEAIGWGFQLQSPLFVAVMMLIFFVLFLSMMEWLHFPAISNRFIYRWASVNAFATGFFAVLIASPCTGPFMGAAIGYAFMRSNTEIFGVFTALALGYALPYALIELYPQKIKQILPKPGKWMTRVKMFLAIPLLLTAIWLGAILYKQLGTSTASSADDLQWLPYNSEEIMQLNEEKANIFIDFTADWCLTCKFNEKLTLQGDNFRRFVEENNVRLYVADMTEDNDEYINALNTYGRSSIPTYIYYSNGSYKVLPVFFGINSLQN